LINLVNKFPKWKPLFAIVYLGDHVLLENLLGNNDDNLGDNGITLLRLAILLSRTKMVEILLRHPGLNLTTPQNENSEMPWKYMSIFHTAAAFTNDTKILDLLLKHSKVKNDTDAQGRSALHIAVMESNETTVRHLLKIKLIDPNARDQNGLSPLHLAAHHTVKTKIIDLIIQATKANPCDRGFDDCDS
jgi:ankyrin repeat protein